MNFDISDNETHIAVALSGGGDFMALAHMMCLWAFTNDRHIHLLTVNHNLRNDFMAEAEQVADWVRDFPNSDHHILTWDCAGRPETAVMEKARQARYTLMMNYCRENSIQTLAVAHHADDQLETFLFRLAKGSGLDGLVGMSEWSKRENIHIYRPLLGHSHGDLIAYCQKSGLQWVDDPSNENQKYARPRLRKTLEYEGFNKERFSKTLDRLSRAQQALEWMVEQAISSSAYQDQGGEISMPVLKTYPVDIQVRVLQKLIADKGRVTHSYPPKLERVEDILLTLRRGKSATLHGCLLSLSKDGNTLEIKASAS